MTARQEAILAIIAAAEPDITKLNTQIETLRSLPDFSKEADGAPILEHLLSERSDLYTAVDADIAAVPA